MKIFLIIFALISSVLAAGTNVFDCILREERTFGILSYLDIRSIVSLRWSCREGFQVIRSPYKMLSEVFDCSEAEFLGMPANPMFYHAVELSCGSLSLNDALNYSLSDFFKSQSNHLIFEWLNAKMISNSLSFVPFELNGPRILRWRYLSALEAENYELVLNLVRLEDTPENLFEYNGDGHTQFLRYISNVPDISAILFKYFRFGGNLALLVPELSVQVLVQHINSIKNSELFSVIKGFASGVKMVTNAEDIAGVFERNRLVFEELEQEHDQTLETLLLKLINFIRFGDSNTKVHRIAQIIEDNADFIRNRRSYYPERVLDLAQSVALLEDEPVVIRILKAHGATIPSCYATRHYDLAKRPKPRCFDAFSPQEMFEFFRFSKSMYFECLNAGIDASDVLILTQFGHFELKGLSDWGNVFVAHLIRSQHADFDGSNLINKLRIDIFQDPSVSVEFILEAIDFFEAQNLPEKHFPTSISLEQMKKILDHHSAETIPRIFSSIGKHQAPYSDLLNSDRYYEIILTHRRILLKSSTIEEASEVLRGLEYQNIRRGFQFIGAPVTGCSIKGKFDPSKFDFERDNLQFEVGMLANSKFKKSKNRTDMLPYVAVKAIGREPNWDFKGLAFKLSETWFQENPLSMLRWAPVVALDHFKHRFAREDVEAVRIELAAGRVSLANTRKLNAYTEVFPAGI